MTEIDYLKCKLEDTEKAFDKLHKRYIELLKQQGNLEKENEELKQKLDFYLLDNLNGKKNMVIDELFSMRIHNENNCEAFCKEIDYLIKRIKEQCGEVMQ